MPPEFGFITPLAAAAALALLWIAEAVAPLFSTDSRREVWAIRLRHGVVAAANAGVASAFAGATLLVTNWAWTNNVGLFNWIKSATDGEWWLLAIISLAALAALDLWHYVFHVLAHKVPVLWRFHVLHHNAEHMEATAAMRFHAAEIAVQCTISLPVYALLGVTIYEILVYQLILLPVALFHHADVRLPVWLERPLRAVIVTPGMHLIHHSRWERETDSNFAAVLSIWDRIFGSYRWRNDLSTVSVGIDGFTREDTSTLRGMARTGLRQPEHAPGETPEAHHLPKELRRKDRVRRLRRRRLLSIIKPNA